MQRLARTGLDNDFVRVLTDAREFLNPIDID
jgi:hypothetical protein